MATPFMNLALPTPTVTLGPAWASELNAALTVVDSHDHSDGKGTRVKTAGISINADLAFNSFAAFGLSKVRLEDQLSSADPRSVYTIGGDLYYTNGSGAPIQLTSGGSIVPTPASADTFSFQIVNANTTLIVGSQVICAVNSTVSSITITLPNAGDFAAGKIFEIKDFSGNSETYPITIALTGGGDTIDGMLSATINSNFGALMVVSDGISNWSAI